jgi:hypothetical protein
LGGRVPGGGVEHPDTAEHVVAPRSQLVMGGLENPGQLHDGVRIPEVRLKVITGGIRLNPRCFRRLPFRLPTATPRIASICSSAARTSTRLVPMLPVAPTTTTRIADRPSPQFVPSQSLPRLRVPTRIRWPVRGCSAHPRLASPVSGHTDTRTARQCTGKGGSWTSQSTTYGGCFPLTIRRRCSC